MINHGPQIEAKKQESMTEAMAISGGLAFAISVISPTLTYLILCGIGYRILTSKDYWNTLANQRPDNFFQPDNAGKVMVGAIAFAGLLFFYQFSLLSQMILAGLASAGLTGYFIQQRVIPSQNALNRALKTAVARSEPQNTAYLLRRGADPYFQDNTGNIAFHDGVQNNRNALQVLQLLKTHARENPTFLSIFEPPRNWQINEQAGQFYQALIDCRDFSQRNRGLLLDATKNLLGVFYQYLANTTNAFVLYYRSKIAYPKNIHSRNNAGNTPADFITMLHIDQAIRPEMAQLLRAAPNPWPPGEGVPGGAHSSAPRPREEVHPRFAPSAPVIPVESGARTDEVRVEEVPAQVGEQRERGNRPST